MKQEVYSMLNESVINLLKNSMWDIATCTNGEPNVVPVAFKDVTEDGKLVVGDVSWSSKRKGSADHYSVQSNCYHTWRGE